MDKPETDNKIPDTLEELINFQPLPGQIEATLHTGEKVWCYGEDTNDCTELEHNYGIDILGSKWEPYNIKAERFVLDWDDTCKDTGKFWIQAHREVLQGFDFSSVEASDDAILAIFGNIDYAEVFGIDRFQKDGKQYTKEEIWSMTNKRAAELLAENPMDPLVIEALLVAKRMGVRLAVWSSSPRFLIEQAVHANDLDGVFDLIVAVDDLPSGQRKPHPTGVYMAVKAMDIARGYLKPDEDYSDNKHLDMNGVWVIGDSPNDVRGGKAAGASTVWLENPLQGHNAHEKREATIRGLAKAALRTAVRDIVPTVTIRTFDPEEMGYSRTTPLSKLDKAEVRKLTTVNKGFADFLTMRGDRINLYRLEHVRNALAAQGANLNGSSEEGLNAIMFQGAVSEPRRMAKQVVNKPRSRAEAKKRLSQSLAKEGAIL